MDNCSRFLHTGIGTHGYFFGRWTWIGFTGSFGLVSSLDVGLGTWFLGSLDLVLFWTLDSNSVLSWIVTKDLFCGFSRIAGPLVGFSRTFG